MNRTCLAQVILFDYGGVLAEEGFREGLMAIARQNGLEPRSFFEAASELVHATGYVTGRVSEHAYWNRLRSETGIRGSDEALRREILSRFVLRPWMIHLVRGLQRTNARLSILSDQTNWLFELDRRDGFFRYFESVFNSFTQGKSKRDPSLFGDVAKQLGVKPSDVLFVDDNAGNVERARKSGFHCIHFRERGRFLGEMAAFCPFLESLRS